MSTLSVFTPDAPSPADPLKPALLSGAEVARLLGLGLRTVFRLADAGVIPRPAVRLSRKLIRWRASDVAAWLDTPPTFTPAATPATPAPTLPTPDPEPAPEPQPLASIALDVLAVLSLEQGGLLPKEIARNLGRPLDRLLRKVLASLKEDGLATTLGHDLLLTDRGRKTLACRNAD